MVVIEGQVRQRVPSALVQLIGSLNEHLFLYMTSCPLFRSEFMNYKGSDNPLLVMETLQARSQCDYKLHDYPNDLQLCDIIVKVRLIHCDISVSCL